MKIQSKFESVVIIGAGLIGSSIARGLKCNFLSNNIIFIDKNTRQKNAIEREGFYLGEYSDASKANLIILAVPVLETAAVLKELKPYLSKEVIVMDVGSVKTSVLRDAQSILQGFSVNFVGAHPIAGKETSGFEAGEAELFKNRAVVLTPVTETNLQAIERIKALWATLGANVFEMTPQDHDLAFAKYSHLSNLVSFLLMSQAQHAPQLSKELLPPSFIEMTRLAGSNPAMWRDICFSNKEAILQILESFEQDLHKLKKLIEEDDYCNLLNFFTDTNNVKVNSF